MYTSRVPVEWKSSVCVICMEYMIIVLIIIIINLGQIILTHMANTSRTHACTHAHTHAHDRVHAHTRPPTASTTQVVAVRWVGVRPTITKSTVSLRFVLSRVCVFLYSLGPGLSLHPMSTMCRQFSDRHSNGRRNLLLIPAMLWECSGIPHKRVLWKRLTDNEG